MAHEIGHNLGLRHDFDVVHQGKGCDASNHIMSYGQSKDKWSLCSKADFESHYILIQQREKYGYKWCMEGNLKVI